MLTLYKYHITCTESAHSVFGVITEVEDGVPVGFSDRVWAVSTLPCINSIRAETSSLKGLQTWLTQLLKGLQRAREKRHSLPSASRTSSTVSISNAPLELLPSPGIRQGKATHVHPHPSWVAWLLPLCTDNIASR